MICTHTNGGYGYPYCLRKDIVMSDTATLKITTDNKQQQSMTLNNNIVTIVPMLLQSSMWFKPFYYLKNYEKKVNFI